MSSQRRRDLEPTPVDIDSKVAHEARVYDFLLGGRDHFQVDRQAGEAHGRTVGGIENARHAVRANRDFLGRAVRFLAVEADVRQFLDLGSGIPNGDNVHQVAQRAAPESRVVYVDYDPIVMAHAHELVNGTTRGATAYVLADLREVDVILEQAAAALNLSEPVAVLFVSMLHFFGGDEPYEIVRRYLDALAPGSFLAVSHMAADIQPDAISALAETAAQDPTVGYRFHPRTKAEVTRFFDGLELVAPGVVPIVRWRAEGRAEPAPPGVGAPPFRAGVGHKPPA